MTIQEIRKEIIQITGIDPMCKKTRSIPAPDVRKLFSKACFEFASDFESTYEFAKKMALNRSTISSHLSFSENYFLTGNSRVKSAYCFFFKKEPSIDFTEKVLQLEKEVFKLKSDLEYYKKIVDKL